MPSLQSPQNLMSILDAWCKSVDSAGETYVRDVEAAVSKALASPPYFDEGWRLICSEVLAGKTDEVHAATARLVPLLDLREARIHHLEARGHLAAVENQGQNERTIHDEGTDRDPETFEHCCHGAAFEFG